MPPKAKAIIPTRRNIKFESELWQAICVLASSSESIKKRFDQVHEYHLKYLDPQSIPQPKNQKKFTAIKNKLTKKNTKTVRQALHMVPLKSCRKMALDLCDIYWDFIHYEWNRRP
jgi:hypothetical protein